MLIPIDYFLIEVISPTLGLSWKGFSAGLAVTRLGLTGINTASVLWSLDLNVWEEFIQFGWGCGSRIRAASGARRRLKQGNNLWATFHFYSVLFCSFVPLGSCCSWIRVKTSGIQASARILLLHRSHMQSAAFWLDALCVYSGQTTSTDGRTGGSCWKTTHWATTSRRMNVNTAAGDLCASAKLSSR